MLRRNSQGKCRICKLKARGGLLTAWNTLKSLGFNEFFPVTCVGWGGFQIDYAVISCNMTSMLSGLWRDDWNVVRRSERSSNVSGTTRMTKMKFSMLFSFSCHLVLTYAALNKDFTVFVQETDMTEWFDNILPYVFEDVYICCLLPSTFQTVLCQGSEFKDLK